MGLTRSPHVTDAVATQITYQAKDWNFLKEQGKLIRGLEALIHSPRFEPGTDEYSSLEDIPGVGGWKRRSVPREQTALTSSDPIFISTNQSAVGAVTLDICDGVLTIWSVDRAAKLALCDLRGVPW